MKVLKNRGEKSSCDVKERGGDDSKREISEICTPIQPDVRPDVWGLFASPSVDPGRFEKLPVHPKFFHLPTKIRTPLRSNQF